MKKSRFQQCVYCGELKETTKDHVIPKCLFTKPLPANLITVPACRNCNGAKSRDDDFLRDFLTMDFIGSQNPMAREIFLTKVLKSDTRNSSAFTRIIRAEAHPEPYFSGGGVYLGTYSTASIDEERVNKIFLRIVRGLYHKARQQRIPDGYSIKVLRFLPHDFETLMKSFSEGLNLAGSVQLGKVFSAVYAVAKEDPFETIWLIWFYKSVCFSVSLEKQMDKSN